MRIRRKLYIIPRLSLRAKIVLLAIFFLSGLFTGVAQIVPGYILSTKTTSQSYRPDFKKEQAILADLFKTKGTAMAVSYFKQSYQSYDPLHRHYIGHFMGDMIYKREGEKGVGLCDSSFEFGCIHGFVMAGVTREGKGFLSRVESACLAMHDRVALEKCLHGLGHGYASYYGYSQEGLTKSLEQCESATPDRPSFCYNGVFMEHNLRPMDISDIGTFSGRPFNSHEPLAPCISLPARYQADCYVEMGSWWSNVIPGQYEQMGKYCDQVLDNTSRENCFSGIGRILTDVNHYDQKVISGLCKQMPDMQATAWCTHGSMGVIITEGEKDPLDICDYLPFQYQKPCVSFGERFLCQEKGICQ